MQDPKPINLTTTAEIRARGWVAEARDADGHLVSTQAWLEVCSTNENLKMLGEFIAEYETDRTVSVFPDVIAAKLAA
ncbi:hypothetical protein [Phaeobacter inhibens]|uniref:hypothetical protein n=1 Tax=Phaeobacter inhibens TaxID=221822 RepID=UPI0001632C90|nr:hypothetical protein [Phaeobacter inhibens]AFO91560.1 hypothetical protein PGA1_c18630 [Phaeobacter inhibens DSM 17395]AUQ46228.1 hypothetical protein PhaeoP10_01890 [Phaeobacter inhibens]